jgi:peptidoglycan hydrolase CwlO-like protein
MKTVLVVLALLLTLPHPASACQTAQEQVEDLATQVEELEVKVNDLEAQVEELESERN